MTKSNSNDFQLRRRQVHLDFHNSPLIPRIARSFDVNEFVQTLQEANVDSVTVFALCHHGWSYYPTAIGQVHPHLERPNLLGDMMDACAEVGIDTPVYISVQWNQRIADAHPEWRVWDGSNYAQHATDSDASAMRQLSPTWHTLCLNHRGLTDHLLDTAREVLENYDPPGLFLDIVSPRDCVCPLCLDSMHSAGYDPLNKADRLAHGKLVVERFKREARAATEEVKPGSRIFFNSGHLDKTGIGSYDDYTHFELESLPTGGWGYGHFPFSARYAATLGKPFLGMTGRFHSSWGDFGGYKTKDALVYETSLSSMLGASCSVGDQLHPSGEMNKHAYDVISHAYSRILKLEPYLDKAHQVTEVGILAAEAFSGRDGFQNNASDDGASRILLETNRCFDVLDSEADFSAYPTLIVPDGVEISEQLLEKLIAFKDQGGSLLFAVEPELTSNFTSIEKLFDVGVNGQYEFAPFYIEEAEGLPGNAMAVHAAAAELLANRSGWHGSITAPYFNRSYRHFCSHDYSPFDPENTKKLPAALVQGRSSIVAFPIFRAFRESGMPQLKNYVDGILNRISPAKTVDISGPSNVFTTLNWQEAQSRFILHVLYGVPETRGRNIASGNFPKGAPIELIEDIPTLGKMDVAVRMDRRPTRLHDALTQEEIPFSYSDGRLHFELSNLKIHAPIAIEVD